MPRTTKSAAIRHPEVPTDDDQLRQTAECTMPRLDGKRDDEVIYYGQPPHHFGAWRLNRTDVPQLLRSPNDGGLDTRVSLGGIDSIDAMLGVVITAAQDHCIKKADMVSLCEALRTLYSRAPAIPPIRQVVAEFRQRNAAWADR